MTTRLPAAPNLLATSIPSMAVCASDMEAQRITPLPSARPSALTAQQPCSLSAKSFAAAASENVPDLAVGIPYFSMNAWENAFEASNCAAFRFGPHIRRPAP